MKGAEEEEKEEGEDEELQVIRQEKGSDHESRTDHSLLVRQYLHIVNYTKST